MMFYKHQRTAVKNLPHTQNALSQSDKPEFGKNDLTVPYHAIPLKTPAEKADDTHEWHAVKVRKGQTISGIFAELGLPKKLLWQIMQDKASKKILTQLFQNQEIQYLLDDENNLQQLIITTRQHQLFNITRDQDHFVSKLTSPNLSEHFFHVRGTIHHSILATIHRNDIPEKIMWQLSNIFSWEINFAKDIREGDKFNIIYTAYYDGNQFIRSGTVIAASITTRHKEHAALYYDNNRGESGYFSPDGYSLRKPFLRYPIHFKRISSPFSLRGRYHPILHFARPHLGIDLAAQTGTPIHATAAGRITFRGRRHGYGNVVVVTHGHGYSTLYAHMSRFKVGEHFGSRVVEGQVIGYVGQTGLATGPHCHYEFRINGIHYDPASVHLPSSTQLTGKLKQDFLAASKPWLLQLQDGTAIADNGPQVFKVVAGIAVNNATNEVG